jgi:phosphatidylserine/phosphatidylglycerophosphate/cardiolipin synthase-like enzyme
MPSCRLTIRLITLMLCSLCRLILSRSFSLLIAVFISVLVGSGAGCVRLVAPAQSPRTTVYFSPDGGATDALVREIKVAQRQILVQAYSFTSAPIAQALAEAHQRGVVVRAILDKSNETAQYTGATFLANAGVRVLVDAKHAIAHNKIMVIDGVTIVTGSFNFTKAAEEHNAENLLILKDNPELVQLYTKNFYAHAAHAVPYRREASARTPDDRRRQEKRVTPETTQQRERSASMTEGSKVRANPKSNVYHLPGCPGYERLNPDAMLVFNNEQEARRAGYRKADNCPSATAY